MTKQARTEMHALISELRQGAERNYAVDAAGLLVAATCLATVLYVGRRVGGEIVTTKSKFFLGKVSDLISGH
jgi:DNA-binding IclR family transcriptional regulator